jgi:hypothetical protein
MKEAHISRARFALTLTSNMPLVSSSQGCTTQDRIVHLKAEHVEALMVSEAEMAPHDFH